MINDPTAFLRKVLIEQSDDVSNVPLHELEEFELQRIERKSQSLGKVGFFCPTEGFEGNFGRLPIELESRGYECIWLFGNTSSYLNSAHKNKFLIINDMCRRIRGIDAIVTASVMDCLPKNTLHVLHDHLSFAHFDLEEHIDHLLKRTEVDNIQFNSLKELFNELSAFVAFTPFYDLILTSSEAVTNLTLNALQLTGYRADTYPMKVGKGIDLYKISNLVDVSSYRSSIDVFQSGYCKLDIPISKYERTTSEKVIVFAPTPNDTSGNKESPLWTSAITVNRYSVDLLTCLCKSFHDYKIVFKPYKDELPDVVSNVREKLSDYKNFELDECGSNYWELYSRAKLLISDFSSTAYTFALGIGRPVVFFSPNEDTLPDSVKNSTYCNNRNEIGVVATNTNEVVKAVSQLIGEYDLFLSRVSNFRKRNCVQPGCASAVAAEAIDRTLSDLKQGKKYSSTFVGTRLTRLPANID